VAIVISGIGHYGLWHSLYDMTEWCHWFVAVRVAPC